MGEVDKDNGSDLRIDSMLYAIDELACVLKNELSNLEKETQIGKVIDRTERKLKIKDAIDAADRVMSKTLIKVPMGKIFTYEDSLFIETDDGEGCVFGVKDIPILMAALKTIGEECENT